MKTLNKTMTRTIFLLLVAVSSFNFSCEGPPGDDGMDGMDGINGTDGEDGQDGNANVQTFTFDTSAQEGSSFVVPFPELTSTVLENDVVLTYVKRGDFYYQTPGVSINNLIEVEQRIGSLRIFFYLRAGGGIATVSPGLYPEVKAIIIESNSSGKSSLKRNPLEELEEAGIDIGNYYEVAGYYGLSI